MSHSRVPIRSGFTLLELLTVIAIIGLIAAFAIPAVMQAMVTASEATVKMEVDALADAVQKYRVKHGDYPPDGSNRIVFDRHIRKVLPSILPSELQLLANVLPSGTTSASGAIANDSETLVSRVMEPAEALVFFLGGFSDDPKHPFTGPGGPFLLTGTVYQYNPNRQNSFFDFDSGRLTLTITTGTPAYTVSNDEGGANNDLLPVYLARKSLTPYVYFDSRTYTQPATLNGQPFTYVNRQSNGSFGTAVPYLSDVANTTSTTAGYFFMNKEGFQVIGTGLDGKFNDIGASIVPTLGNIQRFKSLIPSKSSDSSFDNVANFCDKPKIGLAAQE